MRLQSRTLLSDKEHHSIKKKKKMTPKPTIIYSLDKQSPTLYSTVN